MSESETLTSVALAAVTVLITALFATRWLWRRAYKRTAAAPFVLAVVALAVGGSALWYGHRPLPAPEQRVLFPGITYIRELRASPRPMVIHVVTIDLGMPGLRFLVTPGDHLVGGDYRARTASQFREEYGLQLVINADFFDPWRDYGIWDYYPHEGDPVNVRGLTLSGGDLVTTGYAPADGFDTLYLTAGNRAAFNVPDGAHNAISGNIMLVVDGVPLDPADETAYTTQPNPRTAIGLDVTGKTLIFILVDGRQPNYSEGATISDMIALSVQYGAHNALNLDGGGSTVLVVEGEDGRSVVLNSPIHNRIPGRERPIANHLGVYMVREN